MPEVTDVKGITVVVKPCAAASEAMKFVHTCTAVASVHASLTARLPRAVRCDP